MAVVDSKYRFVLVDIGAEGRQGDGGVFKASEIGQGLEQGTLNLPKTGLLPGCRMPRVVPCAFVGDEAFQLRPDFLRPYPAKDLADEKRIYNYRLSRARRCVENTFGITAARWRILLRTINLRPQNADYVVKACCVLHNYLLAHREHPAGYPDQDDHLGNPVPGGWRQETPTLQASHCFRCCRHMHATSVTTLALPESCTCITSVARLERFPGSGTSLA
ncbi:unnamed protein product [Ixodes hexagonus]